MPQQLPLPSTASSGVNAAAAGRRCGRAATPVYPTVSRPLRAAGLALLLGLAAPLAWAAGAPVTREVVPVGALVWSLRAMIGSWLLLMLLVCVLAWRGPGLPGGNRRFALWALALTLPLPWIAMISGWLVLELGLRPQPGPDAAAAVGSARTHLVALLGWGSGYALLLLINLKLSLRWLRLDGAVAAVAPRREPERDRDRDREPEPDRDSSLVSFSSEVSEKPKTRGSFTERLAKKYRPGVGESEFDMVVEEHDTPPPKPRKSSRSGGADSGRASRASADVANDADESDEDLDKLRRAIARLRKERNALRQVLKTRRDAPPTLPPVSQPMPMQTMPPPIEADGETEGGDTQMIPVLRDVVWVRRS